MNVNTRQTDNSTVEPGGPKGPPGGPLRRWLSFLIATALLGGIVFMAPALEDIEGWGPKIKALRESGLETGAIFYGQVEKIAEIEYTLIHLRDYSSERRFPLDGQTDKPPKNP